VSFLRGEAIASFNDYMHKLVGQGLSTKVAADISVKLVQGIFNPIAAQIEPLRLAEMQRATAITLSYGERLSSTGKNVQQYGLEVLVAGYPSHGFVIDRKEARTIFTTVASPTKALSGLCYDFNKTLGSKVNDQNPIVDCTSLDIDDDTEGAPDGQKDTPIGATKAGSGTSQPNRAADAIKGSNGAAQPKKPSSGRVRKHAAPQQ
jgi:hypothetical protein